MNIVRRNNISIEGNLGSSKAIVFAHGFGTDQTVWRKLKPYFEFDYKMVLYDNTGSGGGLSDVYDHERYSTLNGYAEDIFEICLALNLKNVVFVGHSVSAMAGIIAHIKHPELFSNLVLICASPRYLNDDDYVGGFEEAELEVLFNNIEFNYYNWVNGFSRSVMKNADKPALREEFAYSLLALRPDIALDAARTIFQCDFRHLLAHVSAKTLILQSENDFAVPAEVGEYMNSRIKGSVLSMLRAEGHFPQLSAASEVASKIKDFIASTA